MEIPSYHRSQRPSTECTCGAEVTNPEAHNLFHAELEQRFALLEQAIKEAGRALIAAA